MKKIKLFITIFVCMFALIGLSACSVLNDLGLDIPGLTDGNDDGGNDSGNTDNNGGPVIDDSNIDLSGITFEDQTFEYTGEALGITVKNLPGTVKVNYTYTKNGKEVEEMVEIGVYEVKAVIINKATGNELKTLTAKLTIKEKEVFDEIKDDANANIKLTYGTTYIQLMKNPDDETQLIAAGLDIYATESIYFVLDDKDEPLNFISLHEDSLSVASIVDNTLVISAAGTYDVIMMFPAGSMVPELLVREGAEASVLYFRGTMNNYDATEENTFTINEDTKVATYEVELAVGDVFLISNYYYSTKFDFNPHFAYFFNFTSGGEFGTDVKVTVAGTYKFEVNLTTKALSVYHNGTKLEEDRSPSLYIRGTMNNWDASTALSKKKVGEDTVAYIALDLNVGDVFKIADDSWGTQFDYGYFKNATSYFKEGGENGNVEVVKAGSYTFEVNTNAYTVTVYYNNQAIIENQGSSNGGGNNGGSTGEYRYQLIINGTQKIDLVYDGPWNYDASFTQYYALGVQLKAGDIITLYNVTNDESWVLTQIDPASMGGMTAQSGVGIKVGETGTYNIYIKMKYEQDNIYFGKQ